MFSGIVEEIGTVASTKHDPGLSTFWIQAPLCCQDVKIGDSLAVNGTCLTVCDFSPDQFMCQAIPETLHKTNLGHLQIGSRVNVERSIQPTTRIGGHFVQGHVDGTTIIKEIVREGESKKVWFQKPSFYETCFIEKGYVTIDGMSLTLVDVTDTLFSICFIPHTQNVTIVQNYQIGTLVNVEIDMLTKTVAMILNRRVA